MDTVTIDQAISRGIRVVNVPVWGLMAMPAALLIFGRRPLAVLVGPELVDAVLVIACGFCFVGAWFWWSIQIPKWRLWAYERVTDIPELKRRAIEAQLTWPDGSIFARTEIKSASHKAREQELERRAYANVAT